MSGKSKGRQGDDGRVPDPRTADRMVNALLRLNDACGAHWSGEYELTGMKIKMGYVDHFDTMVVVTAQDGQGAPVVAFHSANLPSEAVVGAINRFLNGTLKWRDDEYATRSDPEGD